MQQSKAFSWKERQRIDGKRHFVGRRHCKTWASRYQHVLFLPKNLKYFYFPTIFHKETERKIFKSNGSFYKICQAPNLYLNWKVAPAGFTSQKFSFVWYVFEEIFGLFWEGRKWPHKEPNLPRKYEKLQNFSGFHAIVFRNFTEIRGLKCWKRSMRQKFNVA